MWTNFVMLLLVCVIHTGQSKCIINNGNYWKLVWTSEFDSAAEIELWDIFEDKGVCLGSAVEDKSCFVRDNIQINDGYAFLKAKHTRHNGMNFTGFLMQSKSQLTYGRYEIRARLPQARFIQSTVKLYHRKSHDGMNILNFFDQNMIERGIYFSSDDEQFDESRKNNSYVFKSAAEAKTQTQQYFHLYGVEWSNKSSRFFYDQHFTPWTIFDDKHRLEQFQTLQFLIGVGSMDFEQKQPKNFKLLEWICPAMILDYVRVYKFSHRTQDCSNDTPIMSKEQIAHETRRVNAVCDTIRKYQNNFPHFTNRFKFVEFFRKNTQYLYLVLALLFTPAIIWMIVLTHRKLNKNKLNNLHMNTTNEESDSWQQYLQNDETFVDINRHHSFDHEPSAVKHPPYLSLEDIYKTGQYLHIMNEQRPINRTGYLQMLGKPQHHANGFNSRPVSDQPYDRPIKESSCSETRSNIVNI